RAETTSSAPPGEVLEAFGPQGPIPLAAWATRPPTDRSVVAKLSGANRDTDAERLQPAHDRIVQAPTTSSHFYTDGAIPCVDVEEKPHSRSVAVAESHIKLGQAAFEQLMNRTAAKGDVLATARVAAIQAAKKTPELIPLCHQIALTKVEVDFDLRREDRVVV